MPVSPVSNRAGLRQLPPAAQTVSSKKIMLIPAVRTSIDTNNWRYFCNNIWYHRDLRIISQWKNCVKPSIWAFIIRTIGSFLAYWIRLRYTGVSKWKWYFWFWFICTNPEHKSTCSLTVKILDVNFFLSRARNKSCFGLH